MNSQQQTMKITLFDNHTVVWRALPEERQQMSAYILHNLETIESLAYILPLTV